jgi:hypothetical protein
MSHRVSKGLQKSLVKVKLKNNMRKKNKSLSLHTHTHAVLSHGLKPGLKAWEMKSKPQLNNKKNDRPKFLLGWIKSQR